MAYMVYTNLSLIMNIFRGDKMIEVQNLTKKYGQILAVNNLDFTINKGEIVGFLGPNGAGKSTTMNMITGFIPATSGTVKVDGFDILENPAEVKKRIGYLPELPPLYLDMTVTEFLNFVADLKNVSKKIKKNHIDEIMWLTKITNVRGRLIKNLSKGYKQRVGIAQALIGDPDTLILDEPTVGLDPGQIIEIRNLVKDLGKERTIILSSHILPEVSQVCQKILIINKGQIAAVGTPDDLSKGFSKTSKFMIKIDGPSARLKSMFKDIPGINKVQEVPELNTKLSCFVIESPNDIDVRRPVFNALAKVGYPILELKSLDKSLEDIFLEIVTNEKEVRA